MGCKFLAQAFEKVWMGKNNLGDRPFKTGWLSREQPQSKTLKQ
jgi:hypothetical protein